MFACLSSMTRENWFGRCMATVKALLLSAFRPLASMLSVIVAFTVMLFNPTKKSDIFCTRSTALGSIGGGELVSAASVPLELTNKESSTAKIGGGSERERFMILLCVSAGSFTVFNGNHNRAIRRGILNHQAAKCKCRTGITHLDTATVVASAVPSRWAGCTELAGDSQRYNAHPFSDDGSVKMHQVFSLSEIARCAPSSFCYYCFAPRRGDSDEQSRRSRPTDNPRHPRLHASFTASVHNIAAKGKLT